MHPTPHVISRQPRIKGGIHLTFCHKFHSYYNNGRHYLSSVAGRDAICQGRGHRSGLKMKRRLCHTKQVARMCRAKQDIKFGQRCSTSSICVNLHAGGPTLSTGIFDWILDNKVAHVNPLSIQSVNDRTTRGIILRVDHSQRKIKKHIIETWKHRQYCENIVIVYIILRYLKF